MKQYVLMMQRDMQGEFTFVERVKAGKTNANIVEQVDLVGHFEQSFGSSVIVACEVLNYKDNMDIDDMILQHPYISEWKLTYKGNYQFSNK